MSKEKPFICNVSEMKPAINPDGLAWLLVQNEFMIVGRHKIAPGQEHPANTHSNEEECFYIIEGKGIVCVGEEERPVTAGTFVYVPRNTRHSMKNNGTAELEYLFFGAFVKDNRSAPNL
jgi:quercetin dioxygenase-like cupin family protein